MGSKGLFLELMEGKERCHVKLDEQRLEPENLRGFKSVICVEVRWVTIDSPTSSRKSTKEPETEGRASDLHSAQQRAVPPLCM